MLPMFETKSSFYCFHTHSSLSLIFSVANVDVNLILKWLVFAPQSTMCSINIIISIDNANHSKIKSKEIELTGFLHYLLIAFLRCTPTV